MDALGYTDDNVAVFLKGSINFLEKFLYIEIRFRKINEKWVVSGVFPGKGSCSGEPACVTSHDLDDGDGFFLINMVCVYKIVINGLRLAEDTDITVDLFGIAGKLADGIHGIISSDIKEPADVHLLEFPEQLRINRIFQRFRKFVTAGAKIGARCPGKSAKLFARKCFLKIKDCSV